MSASISGSGITPGRSSVGSPASDSTVDSIPTSDGPPSSTASANSSGTWSEAVGESSVKRLALGAAIGTRAARISSSATGCAGIRNPTVGSPAVTMSGSDGPFGSTIVNGPGQ
jgi:hypothetical protein